MGNDTITVPDEFIRRDNTYCLRVRGDSMIDDGIRDGDYIIVEGRETATDGETVVALINGEATVKKLYREGDGKGPASAGERHDATDYGGRGRLTGARRGGGPDAPLSLGLHCQVVPDGASGFSPVEDATARGQVASSRCAGRRVRPYVRDRTQWVAACASASGIRTVKTEPAPGVEHASSSPSSAATLRRTTAVLEKLALPQAAPAAAKPATEAVTPKVDDRKLAALAQPTAPARPPEPSAPISTPESAAPKPVDLSKADEKLSSLLGGKK